MGLHGLKGYIKVKSFLENPKDLFNFDKYFINKVSFSSLQLKFNKKSIFICELSGINSMEEAKNLLKQVFLTGLIISFKENLEIIGVYVVLDLD